MGSIGHKKHTLTDRTCKHGPIPARQTASAEAGSQGVVATACVFTLTTDVNFLQGGVPKETPK